MAQSSLSQEDDEEISAIFVTALRATHSSLVSATLIFNMVQRLPPDDQLLVT